MFRFENHMPDYWMNESRDFQLLTRLNDIMFMGQRADIATIQNLNDSKKCKNTFLNLLAKKVGFFTDKYIEENVLRNIIGAFKIAIKHKGTKIGIEYAVRAILKAENSRGVPEIQINNSDYSIDIFTPVNIKNVEALNEFLKYIIPAGYIVNIYSYIKVPTATTQLNNIDRIIAASMNIATMASLRPGYYDIPTTNLERQLEFAERNDDGTFSLDDNGNVIQRERTDYLSYIRKTYAGSMNAGLIASIQDLQSIKAESAKLKKSNNDLDHGIDIEER